MEIEAKFNIPDPGTYWSLQTTKDLAGYNLTTQEVRSIRDTYLDTSKRLILAAGYSCRRRTRAASTVMTLKSLEMTEGAIHRRQEYEVTLASALSPGDWPDSPARDLVLQLGRQEPLETLFELQQTRVIRMLNRDGQSLAELSLDRVSLIVDGNEQVYHELEVELLPSGSEQILNIIVDCLQNEWYLQPESLSKFERALATLDSMPGDDISGSIPPYGVNS
jgi:inorganic triphosphatase YgiF